VTPKFKSSKAFHKASLMPESNHWPDKSQPFEWSKSEVIQWLVSQPEIQAYIFYKLTQSDAIAFNPETSTWKGTAH